METGFSRNLLIFLQKSILLLARHWFLVAILLTWVVLSLALLAPALMAADQPEAGQAIYRFLAPHDHQLPQRSYFLFSSNGMTLPLLVDGFSHMLSENSGAGFRQGNAWAVALTGGMFSAAFYEGTTIGSLNWLLRTVTGLLFGLALVWFLFSYLSMRFEEMRTRLEPKFQKHKS